MGQIVAITVLTVTLQITHTHTHTHDSKNTLKKKNLKKKKKKKTISHFKEAHIKSADREPSNNLARLVPFEIVSFQTTILPSLECVCVC